MIPRVRWIAALVLLAVLLAGITAGWMLEDVTDDVEWSSFGFDRDRGSEHEEDDPMDDDAEEDFLEGLGLTTSQNKAVDGLLDEREDRLEEYWAGKLPEMEMIVDSSRIGIRNLLTPDQRASYERWLAEQRTRLPME